MHQALTQGACHAPGPDLRVPALHQALTLGYHGQGLYLSDIFGFPKEALTPYAGVRKG